MRAGRTLALITILPFINTLAPAETPANEKALSVDSREYKLLLNTRRFADATQGAQTFSNAVSSFLAAELEASIEFDFSDIDRRETRYIDTAALDLYHKGFIVKEKTDAKDGETKLSLKYRALSRSKAASTTVAARLVSNESSLSESKLEHEISPTLELFARSSALKIDTRTVKLRTVRDLANLFPVLLRAGAQSSTAVETVHQFVAEELVLPGKLDFGPGQKIKTRLVFWKSPPGIDESCLVEFSYSIKLARLQARPGLEARIQKFFDWLRASDWCGDNQVGKDSYAFELDT